jgi:L-asparaginase
VQQTGHSGEPSRQPRVPILFTGGTISMRIDPAAGGAVPQLSGEELLALAPDAAAVADLEPIDFDRAAGWRVSPAWMWRLIEAAREALGAPGTEAEGTEQNEVVGDRPSAPSLPPAAGVVVTHGTDTLEESAFLLDCVLDDERPVVFTGAMRNASESGWDGPRNLVGAVRVAASPAARGRGALVVLNDTIFAAHGATKTHAARVDTFADLQAGPLGVVEPDGVRFFQPARRRLTVPAPRLETRVDLLVAASGGDDRHVRASLDAGARGLVVIGTGRGNVPPELVPALAGAVAAGVPVAVCTRCPAGRVLPVYADAGSGRALAAAGAWFAGELPAHKARLLLMLTLGAAEGQPLAAARRWFDGRADG